jgi:hypothetical protein
MRRACSRSRADGAEAAARYRSAAERAAEVILGGLLGPDGRLGRSWKDGRATGQGVLEDYANLAEGLLALYEATFDERWFSTARQLADAILERFADPEGGFYDTATGPRAPRHPTEGHPGQRDAIGRIRGDARAPPLAAFTGESRYREAAERALATGHRYTADTRPRSRCGSRRSTSRWRPWPRSRSSAIRGRGTRSLLAVASGGYEPNRVVAVDARRCVVGDPAARRSHAARWPADRLRLPKLRLPPARHRPRRTSRPARRSSGGRLSRWTRFVTSRRRPSPRSSSAAARCTCFDRRSSRPPCRRACRRVARIIGISGIASCSARPAPGGQSIGGRLSAILLVVILPGNVSMALRAATDPASSRLARAALWPDCRSSCR